MERLEHKRQLQQAVCRACRRAIHIPVNATIIPDNAFYAIPRLRKLSPTPDRQTTCYHIECQGRCFAKLLALITVVAPGCVNFGRRACAECCSLQYTGISEDGTNKIVPGATFAPYAFESCLALSQIELVQTSMGPSPPSQSSLTRGVPEGCFSSSGLDWLKLPSDVNFLGPLACENCKRLAFVDLSSTSIEAIWGSTFSH